MIRRLAPMISDAERTDAAELARLRVEAPHWNSLLNRCGTAVGMRAGDDIDNVPERVETRIAELGSKLADREETLERARVVAIDLSGQVMEVEDKLSRAKMALHVEEDDAGNALGRWAELEQHLRRAERYNKWALGLAIFSIFCWVAVWWEYACYT